MKKTLLIFVSIFISFSLNSQKKNIDSLTKKMTISKGIINSFTDNNKLFFEIPTDLLNKEILVVTRLAQVPSGYSPYINAGSKTSEQVISFFKKNNRVDIKQLSFNNIAIEEDPINQSVTENNFSPILASFEIKNDDETSLLIDVSDYFLKDSPGFNIINPRLKDNYKIGSVDKKRSSIDSVKSFPKNIEIDVMLTFKGKAKGSYLRSVVPSPDLVTVAQHHSFVALPELDFEKRMESVFDLNKNINTQRLDNNPQ